MIESYSSGRNELFAQFRTSVTGINGIAGYTIPIVYQGVESPDKMPTDKVWIRLSQQTVLESQATLSGNDLKRRYTTDGLMFAQVFIPKAPPENYAKGLEIANLIKKAFRGKQTSSCMWFRNVRIQELPPEDAWFRINVISEYHYDEIG